MQVPKENKITVKLTEKKAQAPTHPTPSMQSERKEPEVEKICVKEENSLSGDTEAVSLLFHPHRHTCQLQGSLLCVA